MVVYKAHSPGIRGRVNLLQIKSGCTKYAYTVGGVWDYVLYLHGFQSSYAVLLFDSHLEMRGAECKRRSWKVFQQLLAAWCLYQEVMQSCQELTWS